MRVPCYIAGGIVSLPQANTVQIMSVGDSKNERLIGGYRIKRLSI